MELKFEKISSKVVPWLFILPALLSITLLRYYPIVQSFFISLHKYDIANPPGEFVGFQNYKDVISIGFFWTACKNTLVYLLLTFLIGFFPAIIQAIFLNEISGRLGRMFRTLYILPTVIPISVFVIIWKWIWNPDYGLANVITKALGLGTFSWLSDPNLAKFCLMFPGILGGGIGVFIYLAAIQGVPQEIYEAAKIDGASEWKKIFYITLPNITFVIFMQMIFTIIGTLQILDLPYQMTLGGPANATTTVALTAYQYVEKNMDYGSSTATSFILMAVILVVTTVQIMLNKSETN